MAKILGFYGLLQKEIVITLYQNQRRLLSSYRAGRAGLPSSNQSKYELSRFYP